MTFDNGRTIIALRLRVFIATVLLIIYIYFAYLGKELKFPLLGIELNTWTLILLAIYATVSFYPLLLNYRFIYFSDDGPHVVFRFYSVGLLGGKKNSVEIPKVEFAGYEIKPYLGIFKIIILARRIDRRVAKYPPIHLSSLKRKEMEKIISALNKINIINNLDHMS